MVTKKQHKIIMSIRISPALKEWLRKEAFHKRTTISRIAEWYLERQKIVVK
jgi:hypothetical protein